MRCMRHEGVHSWLDSIPMVELAINNSVQDATQASPAHLAFGQSPKLPLDMLDGMANHQGAQELVTTWAQLTTSAREHLRHAQALQKRYADRRRRPVDYHVGDQVLLSTKNL